MADRIRPPWEEYDREYRAFQEREGLPVHEGIYVEDVQALALAEWPRTGGRGAFVNLLGMEGMCDVQLLEIPPGAVLEPQRHLHEALVFAAAGSGVTTVGTGEAETSFEWSAGSLFQLPRNARYVHANAGEEPALLVCETSLPLLYSLLQDDAAIWDVEGYDGWEGVRDGSFYASVAELTPGTDVQGRTYWDANFVPDATSFDNLVEWEGRGVANRSVFFPFRDASMHAHISEFEAGQYKKAHRHVCGANVLILGGEGYSLMWKEGGAEEPVRVPWGPNTLFTPPTMWFHQHFNTSPEGARARYLVFHAPTYRLGIRGGRDTNDAIAPWNPLNQIEYHEEDPAVRERFERELEERGVDNRMDESLYAPPDDDASVWE